MKKTLNKNKSILIGSIIGIVIIAIGVFLTIFIMNYNNSSPDEPTVTNSETSSDLTKNQNLSEFNSDYYSTLTTTPSTTYRDIQNSILIDDYMQENLNIFLSNFSEVNFTSFSEKTSSKELVPFAILHNHINKSESVFEDADIVIDGKSFDKKLHQKYVIQTVQQFFGITLVPDDFSEFDYYKDEYFYNKSTDQKISFGFSIANNLESVGAGLYRVDFTIYDSSEYENLHNVYTMSPSDILAEGAEKIGSGSAIIKIDNLTDRNTFTLKSYERK